jgi:hypothetical protein
MNIRQFASAAELCYEAEIRRIVPILQIFGTG